MHTLLLAQQIDVSPPLLDNTPFLSLDDKIPDRPGSAD